MNLRVVAASLVVSFKSFYREKTTMFFTVTFPIMLILVFGTIFMDDDKVNYNLCVQDLDQTETSAEVSQALAYTGKLKLTMVDPAIDATQYAKDNQVNLVLVIPRGYEEAFGRYLQSDNPSAFVTFTYIYDPSSVSVVDKMQILEMVFARLNQGLTAMPSFIRTETVSIHTRKYRFIEFFIPGIIAMMVMTESLFGTVNVNTELRQKGIIRKLATTPITRTEWIVSNILYQFMLAVIATTAMLLVGYGVFDVKLQINGWLPLFIVLDVFMFVGIGMLLTRVVTGGAERRRRRQRRCLSDDVPLGEFLSSGDDAALPADLRQSAASVLCQRGPPGLHGISRQHGFPALRRYLRGSRHCSLHFGHNDHPMGGEQVMVAVYRLRTQSQFRQVGNPR